MQYGWCWQKCSRRHAVTCSCRTKFSSAIPGYEEWILSERRGFWLEARTPLAGVWWNTADWSWSELYGADKAERSWTGTASLAKYNVRAYKLSSSARELTTHSFPVCRVSDTRHLVSFADWIAGDYYSLTTCYTCCDTVTTVGVVLAWNRNVALWALNKSILNHNNWLWPRRSLPSALWLRQSAPIIQIVEGNFCSCELNWLRQFSWCGPNSPLPMLAQLSAPDSANRGAGGA